MTGKLSKNFHGVGIGPLSNILAVKVSGTIMHKIKCYFKKDTDSYLILFYFKVSGTMMHKIKCTDCEELRKCNIIHQTGLKVVLSPDHLIAFH